MDRSVEWVYTEISKGSHRTVKAHGERRYRTRMQLTGSQKQAATDIEIAYELMRLGWGYALLGIKTVNMQRIKGGQPTQDQIDAIRKRIGRLNEWEFDQKPQIRLTVMELSTKDITPTEYASQLGLSYQTIVNWYKEGLDNYGEMFF